MESSDWRTLIRHSAELRARSAQAREASAQLIAVSKQLAIWRTQRRRFPGSKGGRPAAGSASPRSTPPGHGPSGS
jgi:hypothetical protein